MILRPRTSSRVNVAFGSYSGFGTSEQLFASAVGSTSFTLAVEWRGGLIGSYTIGMGLLRNPRVWPESATTIGLRGGSSTPRNTPHIMCMCIAGSNDPFAALSCALRLEWNVSGAGVSLYWDSVD